MPNNDDDGGDGDGDGDGDGGVTWVKHISEAIYRESESRPLEGLLALAAGFGQFITTRNN